MVNAILGRGVLLTVTFRSFNDSSDTGSPVDPDTVVGTVLDSNNNNVLTFAPSNDSVGQYSYLWVPDTVGTFTVIFTGTYSDSSQDIISETFLVTASAESTFLSKKLGDDQTLQFMPTLDGVFIDPEEITPIFPDAPTMEIVEFIKIYSKEVQEILGKGTVDSATGKTENIATDPSTWETAYFEYIRAATLCALSKFYGFGDADLTQITLGDLEVTNQRFGRTTINRANAVTWCEIAGALRMEIISDSGRAGFKQFKKGSKYANPIPHRWLKQYEHGRF